MPNLVARVWNSSPDVFDGFFVEIVELRKNYDLQIDCVWQQTEDLAIAWAYRKYPRANVVFI